MKKKNGIKMSNSSKKYNNSIDTDEFAFKLIDVVRQTSEDPDTKVGCVIFNKDFDLISVGSNRFPNGIAHPLEKSSDKEYPFLDEIYLSDRITRPTKYMYMEHAERNAIYSAAKRGVSLKDCILYVDWIPCTDCARAIIQSGISEVIMNKLSPSALDKSFNKRWKESMKISKTILTEANVKMTTIEINTKE
jgi:dCMP deaminase